MLFINAKIWTMEDVPIANGFLQVKNGKFIAVGPMDKMTEYPDPEIIDVKGAYIFPGFIDAHCHAGALEEVHGPQGTDINETSNPSMPHVKGINAINPRDNSMADCYRGGVTTIVTGPGSGQPITGQLAAVKTYGDRIDDMVIKESIAMKMAMGENPKRIRPESYPETRMGTAQVIEENLMKAKEYIEKKRAAQRDSSKTPPAYDAKMEALSLVLEKKLPVHCHAHRADDILTAIRIMKPFGIKPIIVHCTEGYLISEYLKEEGVSAIVGPYVMRKAKPECENLSPVNPGILNKAGVEIAICTDFPVIPVNYLPMCAGVAVKEGMDHYEALKALTINPAKICGIDDRVGSIKEGKDADFSIFAMDPLSVYARPTEVYINGKKVYEHAPSTAPCLEEEF